LQAGIIKPFGRDEKRTWFVLCEAPFGPFRQNKPGPFFVLLAVIVTPSLLAKRIENIATRADMVEKVLAKEDAR